MRKVSCNENGCSIDKMNKSRVFPISTIDGVKRVRKSNKKRRVKKKSIKHGGKKRKVRRSRKKSRVSRKK
jgi:hypothetical protein